MELGKLEKMRSDWAVKKLVGCDQLIIPVQSGSEATKGTADEMTVFTVIRHHRQSYIDNQEDVVVQKLDK